MNIIGPGRVPYIDPETGGLIQVEIEQFSTEIQAMVGIDVYLMPSAAINVRVDK